MTILVRRARVFAVPAMALFVAAGCRLEDAPSGTGSGAVAGGPNMVVELPSGRTVSGQNSFSCRSLMEADMTGSYDATLTKGLEGKVSARTGTLSVLS